MVKRKKNYSVASSAGTVFGEVLRIKREDAGLTQEEAAELIHVERSLITKFENGERVPGPAHVENLDLTLGGRGELIRLHRRIDWTVRMSRYPDWFARRTRMDAELTQLHQYQTQLIPDLLQSEDYARAWFAQLARGDAHGDSIEGRMARQRRFLEADGPLYVALLDESCLLHQVGGPAVMREQLDHLLRVGELPNIRIQIVPFSLGHVSAPQNPTSLIVLPSGQRWMYSESVYMGHFSNDPEMLTQQQHSFDLLRSDSLSARESAALISDVREKYSLPGRASQRTRCADPAPAECSPTTDRGGLQAPGGHPACRYCNTPQKGSDSDHHLRTGEGRDDQARALPGAGHHPEVPSQA